MWEREVGRAQRVASEGRWAVVGKFGHRVEVLEGFGVEVKPPAP